MADIEFTSEEKEILVQKVKGYFNAELDQDIGQFDAEFLIDFVSREIGPYFYNRGLYDAQALVEDKIETLTEAFYEIEKPTDFMR
jgi:uncharacterized protein (DUF2164 family)